MMRSSGLSRNTQLKRGKPLNRSAPKKKRPRDTGPKKDVKDLVRDDRAEGKCERCGQEHGCHVHHRDPRGMGGTSRPEANYASNLIFLCVLCHLWVETNRLAAIGDGYLIPDMYEMDQWNTPVKLSHGTYLLKDDGSREPRKTRTKT